MSFQRDEVLKRAETTAEFYLVLGAVPGAANFCHAHMHGCLEEERSEPTDWLSLRYGSFTKMVYPEERTIRVAPDTTNEPSNAFFRKKRRYGGCGEVYNEKEIACRITRDGVIGVELTWDAMYANHRDTREASYEELAILKDKAGVSREARQRSTSP